MKKFYLFISFILSVIFLTGYSQQINRTIGPQTTDQRPDYHLDPAGGIQQDVIIGQKLSSAIIGETWYDLQTYGAMAQRMYAYPDGTIGATWMMALEVPDWGDRGAGYNYFDGSDWGDYPTERVESIRTGWPVYAPLGENGEIIVSHALPDPDGDWVLLFNHRDTKGEGDWEEFTLAGPEAGVGIVWPSMVTAGTDHNIIHILARTYGNDYMGQTGALVYSRSSDGGATWDIQNHFFDELGPDYFTAIDADGFAWAQPKGNTLAFTVGFDIGHACFMKSLDGGDTWTFTEVYHCPFYPAPGVATPPFGAGDGTQACAIDSDDNVHIVYGRMRHVYDETGAGLYYPLTEGLIYWNETMEPLDTTIISTYTLDFLEASGNLVGRVVDPGTSGLIDFPSYYTSLTSHPQITIDQNDRMFVIYAGAAPGFDNGTWNFRHIYGNSSNDGGETWNGIYDFNDELVYIFSECVYPAMAATVVDNQISFIFQDDNEPGIFVWAAQQAAAGLNNISFMSHPTAILTGIGDEATTASTAPTLDVYPNPFTHATYVQIRLPEASHVSILINDISGKQVHVEDFGYLESGKHHLELRLELPSGLYIGTAVTAQGRSTAKMLID
jgi:hypothetical protein